MPSPKPPHGSRKNTVTTHVINGVNYQFTAHEVAYPRTRPVPNAYWIQIALTTRRYNRDKPQPGTPVRYDPLGATLRINGRAVRVTQAWIVKATFEEGHTKHRWRALTDPIDWRDFPTRSVYLAFAVPAPAATDNYEFVPGAASIDDKFVQLPTSRTCYAPRETYFKQAIS